MILAPNGVMRRLTPAEEDLVFEALQKLGETEANRYSEDTTGRPFRAWWKQRQERAKKILSLAEEFRPCPSPE